MTIVRYVVTFCALLAVSIAPSIAATSNEVVVSCEKNQSPLNGGYCITKTQGSGNQDVLYYFHGSGLSESTWLDEAYYTAQIRQQWHETQTQPPTVISISFGPQWILAEKNTSSYSGLFEIFTQLMLPKIERELGGIKGRRFLLGESMGGFNSIQMALKTKLFERVAILCAPIGEISPFSTQDEIDKFIEKTAANRENVLAIIKLGQAFFTNENEWQTASPLALAQTADTSSAAELYIAAGYYDQYGLYAGNETFSKTLKKRGAKIDWRPQWGGHCAIDIPSLASFLSR